MARLDVRSDQPIPTSGDIYLIGGGEDRPQRLASERLRRDGGLQRAVENGAIVFSVCAGYQILGHEFINDLGQREPGLAAGTFQLPRVGLVVGEPQGRLAARFELDELGPAGVQLEPAHREAAAHIGLDVHVGAEPPVELIRLRHRVEHLVR